MLVEHNPNIDQSVASACSRLAVLVLNISEHFHFDLEFSEYFSKRVFREPNEIATF